MCQMDFTCILPAWFPGFWDAPNFGGALEVMYLATLVPLGLPESLPNNFVSEVLQGGLLRGNGWKDSLIHSFNV